MASLVKHQNIRPINLGSYLKKVSGGVIGVVF